MNTASATATALRSEESVPSAAEVTGWLLEGRFFTVDQRGAITLWSPPAADAFGWSRRDIVGSGFAETLIAPAAREGHARRLEALLAGEGGTSGFRCEVDALDGTGAGLRAAFATVPIYVGVGYEFNGVLQEIATSARTAHSLAQLKARDESVLELIDDALAGRHAAAGETEDARRLAGALVVFRVLSEPRPAPPAITAADAAEERLRAELGAAREDAARAGDELAEARRRLTESGAELARVAAELEAARARDESLSDQLRALSAEAAETRTLAERGTAELERARSELLRERAGGEEAVAVLRAETGRLAEQLAGMERALEEARARAARAGAAEAEVARLAAELERSRSVSAGAAPDDGRLESAIRDAQAARADADEARRSLDQAGAAVERLTDELSLAREGAATERSKLRAEIDAARERAEGELAAARRDAARAAGELEATRAWAEALQAELATLSQAAAEARAGGERAAAELAASTAELASLREQHARETADARAEIDRLAGELRRTEAAGRREADLAAARGALAARGGTAPAPPDLTPKPTAKQRVSLYLDELLSVPDAPELPGVAPEEGRPREPVSVDELLELARAVDAKNPYARGHLERVARYAVVMAEDLGFEPGRRDMLERAALLHDVGKSEIDDALVARDDPLNFDQLERLARHSQIGSELLTAAGQPKLAEWIRHVHERFDGGGHPLGLAAERIPEESRILHVADALDHMSRPRVYRRDRPLREALAELSFCSGTRLDPDLTARAVALVESGKLQIGAMRRRGLGRPLAATRGHSS